MRNHKLCGTHFVFHNNECEQEQVKNCSIPAVINRRELLKAAKDRMKSFRMNINPHIKMFKFHLKNPLYIGRDYRFHDNLTKVSNELYKDKVISKEEKYTFIRIYDDEATFENLRKLLHDKYGYDGIIYRNNIEDRGSNSYIAFYPEQVEFVGNYEE